jgi:hypothetical protein
MSGPSCWLRLVCRSNVKKASCLLFSVCDFKYGINQFINLHLSFALHNGIAHAAFHMAFHDNPRHAAKSFFGGADLVDDINAVFLILYHFHYTAYLALNTLESSEQFLFCICIDHVTFSPCT